MAVMEGTIIKEEKSFKEHFESTFGSLCGQRPLRACGSALASSRSCLPRREPEWKSGRQQIILSFAANPLRSPPKWEAECPSVEAYLPSPF
ncbi:MAG: hypothetical protein ABSB40_03645 [Nitrososphaeria archaeon]